MHVVRHLHQRTRDAGLVTVDDIEDGLSLADDEPYLEWKEAEEEEDKPQVYITPLQPNVLDSLRTNAIRIQSSPTLTDRIIALAMVGCLVCFFSERNHDRTKHTG